jgi:hypothetical protein
LKIVTDLLLEVLMFRVCVFNTPMQKTISPDSRVEIESIEAIDTLESKGDFEKMKSDLYGRLAGSLMRGHRTSSLV